MRILCIHRIQNTVAFTKHTHDSQCVKIFFPFLLFVCMFCVVIMCSDYYTCYSQHLCHELLFQAYFLYRSLIHYVVFAVNFCIYFERARYQLLSTSSQLISWFYCVHSAYLKKTQNHVLLKKKIWTNKTKIIIITITQIERGGFASGCHLFLHLCARCFRFGNVFCVLPWKLLLRLANMYIVYSTYTILLLFLASFPHSRISFHLLHAFLLLLAWILFVIWLFSDSLYSSCDFLSLPLYA